MNRGIIYFNTGRKCLIRLIVSIYSLRKVYNGPLALLFTGEEQPEYDSICKQFNMIKSRNKSVAEEGKNAVYLEKCLTHLNSPFDTTIWIDSDTIILKDPSEDLWTYAEQNEFAICQFSNWKSNGSKIRGRIESWQQIFPDKMEAAINFGPAINCGMISFRKDSKLMKDWYGFALQGRENFIPDEVTCQIILPQYPHIILDDRYNTSCKYSKIHNDTRIIHFHGRKHCRLEENNKPLFMADVWINYYKECSEKNICNLNNLDIPDRKLKKFIMKTGGVV
jgi:hypothetical protein